MKKIALITLLAVLPCVSSAARYARPYKLNEQSANVSVAREQPIMKSSIRSANSGVYMGLHADVSFLNWKNKYKDAGIDVGSDTFKMKNVIGVGADFGYRFNDKWATELEFGYIGKYSESEKFSTDKTDYYLSAMYFGVNGLYDIYNGIYAGVGTGAAVVKSGAE